MTKDEYHFDEVAAERVCRFFETQLRHWKGEWAGQPFKLLGWQRQILRDVFGWKRQDGTRRYRFVYIELPRKNGKSFFASGIALYLLCADNEPGAEVYSAAVNTKQANIVFNDAKKSSASSPGLRKRIKPYRQSLTHPSSNSVYSVLSGEEAGTHGMNIHGLIIDEAHEWTRPTDRDRIEAYTTSMGARRQPLTVVVTTAGHGGNPTICREWHDEAERVLAGESEDDTFYAVIYAADPKDKWDSPATWKEANPSYGQSVSKRFLETEASAAKGKPHKINSFLRLYLNIWTQQQTRWLDPDVYLANTGPVNYEDYKGQPCYLSWDLGQNYDITAVQLIYPQPEKWVVIPRFYCPADIAEERKREDGFDYPEWIDRGHMIGTPGEVTDPNRVFADVQQLAAENQIIEAAYDPNTGGTLLAKALENQGIKAVPIYPESAWMKQGTKEFERKLTAREFLIQDNPVMTWMANNVEVKAGRDGNVLPAKPAAKGRYAGTGKYKIDGVVAAIIAMSRAINYQPDTTEYDTTIHFL